MLGSRHPCQRRNLSLGCMHDKVTDDVVLEIARKSPQIQQLDLTYCEGLTEEGEGVHEITAIFLPRNEMF